MQRPPGVWKPAELILAALGYVASSVYMYIHMCMCIYIYIYTYIYIYIYTMIQVRLQREWPQCAVRCKDYILHPASVLRTVLVGLTVLLALSLRGANII